MSYQDYYAPKSWYEPEVEEYESCRVCEKHESKLENAKDFFTGISQMLYSKSELNVDDFDWMMEQMAHYLDADMPEGKNILGKLQQKKLTIVK